MATTTERTSLLAHGFPVHTFLAWKRAEAELLRARGDLKEMRRDSSISDTFPML
jgi:hypothetical protein